MKTWIMGILTFASLSATAEVTFLRCTAARTFASPGCPKQGCYDVSVGINQDGQAKAIAWHVADGRRSTLEVGQVQTINGALLLDGTSFTLSANNAPISIATLKLIRSEVPALYQVTGTATVSADSGDRELSLECYEMNAEKFKNWASSTDSGNHRQLVMRELFESMN